MNCHHISHLDESTCGGQILGQTQHYVYKIVAQHLLAVCYYGLNYGEDRAFEPWASYSRSDGYCSAFEIPSRDEVLRNKAAK